MAMYVTAFAVPKGSRDRVLFRHQVYRNHFMTAFEQEEPIVVQPGGPFLADYEHWPLTCRVVSARRYLEIADSYRKEFDRDYPAEGPMYIDDMTAALDGWHATLDELEIVVVPEI